MLKAMKCFAFDLAFKSTFYAWACRFLMIFNLIFLSWIFTQNALQEHEIAIVFLSLNTVQIIFLLDNFINIRILNGHMSINIAMNISVKKLLNTILLFFILINIMPLFFSGFYQSWNLAIFILAMIVLQLLIVKITFYVIARKIKSNMMMRFLLFLLLFPISLSFQFTQYDVTKYLSLLYYVQKYQYLFSPLFLGLTINLALILEVIFIRKKAWEKLIWVKWTK